jgi:hypothetical protein
VTRRRVRSYARPSRVRRATGKTSLAYKLYGDKASVNDDRKQMILDYLEEMGVPMAASDIAEHFGWTHSMTTGSNGALMLLFEEGKVEKVYTKRPHKTALYFIPGRK